MKSFLNSITSKMYKAIFFIFASILSIAGIYIAVFIFSEKRRDELIEEYSLTEEITEKLNERVEGELEGIFEEGETLICALGAYGDPENLILLNENQRTSIQKSNLPSNDLSWYLLFFHEDSISRIYMMDSLEILGDVEKSGAGCVDRKGYFRVSPSSNSVIGEASILNLTRTRTE